MRASRAVLGTALLGPAVVLDVTVLARLPLPGAAPSLVVLLLVALAMGYGPGFGAAAGFAGGLAMDVVPPADSAVGRWALVLALVGYAAGTVPTRLRGSIFLPLAAAALATAASMVGYGLTGVLTGDSPGGWRLGNALIGTAVLYSVVLSAVLVPAVLSVVRRFEPEPTGGGAGAQG